MTKLSRDDVLALASLCRLRLSEQEISSLAAELSEILSYVEVLNQADTTGLEPTYQVTGLKNVMRPDEVTGYGYEPAELLNIAPNTEAEYYKVKRVLE